MKVFLSHFYGCFFYFIYLCDTILKHIYSMIKFLFLFSGLLLSALCATTAQADGTGFPDKDKVYVINRFGNQSGYIFQSGSQLLHSSYNTSNRQFWRFIPTEKENCFYIQNVTTGWYIQSCNLPPVGGGGQPVPMGEAPVEYQVCKDNTAGASTNGYYYMSSTDQGTIDNSKDGTLGLNFGANGVVAFHIKTGRGNSYWEITETTDQWTAPNYTHSPYARANGIYFLPCGTVDRAYLKNLAIRGKDVTDELNYSATARPSKAYTLHTSDKATVQRDGTFELSYTAEGISADTHVGMWFDWDGDGVFDICHSKDGESQGTIAINVPDTARLGKSRLRIRLTDNAMTEAEEDVIGTVYDFIVNVSAMKTDRIVTVSPNDTLRGSVVLENAEGTPLADGSTVCAAGDRFTVKAIKKGNAVFRGWKKENTIISTASEYSFDVTQDMELTAVFSPNTQVTTGIDNVNGNQPATVKTSLTLSPSGILSAHSSSPVRRILVYTPSGRRVAQAKAAEVPVKHLPKGTYVVKVTTDAGESGQKIKL